MSVCMYVYLQNVGACVWGSSQTSSVLRETAHVRFARLDYAVTLDATTMPNLCQDISQSTSQTACRNICQNARYRVAGRSNVKADARNCPKSQCSPQHRIVVIGCFIHITFLKYISLGVCLL